VEGEKKGYGLNILKRKKRAGAFLRRDMKYEKGKKKRRKRGDRSIVDAPWGKKGCKRGGVVNVKKTLREAKKETFYYNLDLVPRGNGNLEKRDKSTQGEKNFQGKKKKKTFVWKDPYYHLQ